jgi:hypothetical protein
MSNAECVTIGIRLLDLSRDPRLPIPDKWNPVCATGKGFAIVREPLSPLSDPARRRCPGKCLFNIAAEFVLQRIVSYKNRSARGRLPNSQVQVRNPERRCHPHPPLSQADLIIASQGVAHRAHEAFVPIARIPYLLPASAWTPSLISLSLAPGRFRLCGLDLR